MAGSTTGLEGDGGGVGKLYWSSFGAGLAWTLIQLALSPGAGHDEVGHVLVARSAWNDPEMLLDWWGRVGFTTLYWVPSLGGILGCRLFSILLGCATVMLATDVARRCGVKHLFLIPLLLWFQPWFGDMSRQAMTEPPFGFFLIVGVAAWLHNRATLGAILIGVLPLIRHEGIALTGLWSCYMLLNRRWVAAVCAFLPVALYNVASWHVTGWIPFAAYFAPGDVDPVYGQGTWYHFLPRVAKWAGIPVVLVSVFSIRRLVEQWRTTAFLLGYGVYAMLHVVIFALGRYSSGGYTFFLQPIAPALAVTAALGVEVIAAWVREHRERAGLASDPYGRGWKMAAVVGLAAQIGSNAVINPVKRDHEMLAMQEAAEWLRDRAITSDQIINSHVWFSHFFPMPVTPDERWDETRDLASLPSGTYVVWDGNFSERWGVDIRVLTAPDGEWELLGEFGDGFGRIFRKR